jgi:hypothetical protein
MECGRCCKVECEECQKVDEEIRQIQAKCCPDDCNCLCVSYRLINKGKDIDILDDNFMIDCGENRVEVNIIKALRKISRENRETEAGQLLEIINDMKTDLIKERVAYKIEKEKMNGKINGLKKDLDAVKKVLKDKFII